MKANSPLERLYNGIIKENPTFVLMLGMCPTLAVTTSAKNGFGMGMTTMVILALSNLMISMLRKMIPDSVRMPAYIVVVASFVTIVQFLLQGFIPSLYDSLGIYIPLIVVVSSWDVQRLMHPRMGQLVLCLTESAWDLDLPLGLPASVSSVS